MIFEPNDTINEANDTGLTSDNPGNFVANGFIGDSPNIPFGEDDVDFFQVQLDAGNRLTVDIDTPVSFLDPILRLFDSEGNQVAVNDDFNGLDSFISFNATASDTYFIGVSSYSNFDYDPFVAGSDFGGSTGEYTINIDLAVGDQFVLASGEGVETIEDFEDNFDKFVLGAGLTLDNLDILSIGNDTAIINDNEVLAIVQNTPAFLIGVEDFIGDDIVIGTPLNDIIPGSSINDTIGGAEGNDSLSGGNGNDLLSGGDGRDTIEGNSGDDSIFGGKGRDSLLGGNGNDTIKGNIGNDTIGGNIGNDLLKGGFGDDSLTGGAGRDRLFGGDGDDFLTGDAGRDRLFGGNGNDLLNGGEGNDLLQGGKGNDFLSGGAGADRFILAAGQGRETIQDFEDNLDKLVLGTGLTLENINILSTGSDTIITNNNNIVLALLENTQASEIDAEDFIF